MRSKLTLDDQFNELMEASDLAQDERTLKQAIKNFANAAGFERFAYLNVRAGNTHALSNYPAEWQRIYLDNEYTTIDPVVILAKRSMLPFLWSQQANSGVAPKAIQFFSEAADFGIRSGISIPVRGTFGRMAMLTLASDKWSADFVEIRNAIHAITAVAFVHVHLNRLMGRPKRSNIELTPRQSLCMTWASLGKTTTETAHLLGISARSVRFYLDELRDKLGADNLTHAVRLAIEQQLI